MEVSQQETLLFLCQSLAKATGTIVRLYRQRECVYEYSVYHLRPDPAGPFLSQLLAEGRRAGVFTTPLFQFYGFVALQDGWRIIAGPSRMENPDPRLLEEQMFLLGVKPQDRGAYQHTLSCFPAISAERMGWLVGFLATAVERRAFPMEALYINVKPEDHREAVQADYAQTREAAWMDALAALPDQSYSFEKLILSYIRQGEPERIREVLHAPPAVQAGKMANDTLRQLKDTGICAAAIASRAAIEGGLDSRRAFQMSDLYIQKIELLRDIPSLEKLRNDIFTDYAEEVRRVRYRIQPERTGAGTDLFAECAEYVTQNIYNPIRVEEMAQALGYTRSYLSSCFKRQTGMTLTQYVLQEKVFEAQRMLEFTDESLLEIANLFAFSSQSHFQNVFKKVTGKTPMEYRKRMKK